MIIVIIMGKTEGKKIYTNAYTTYALDQEKTSMK